MERLQAIMPSIDGCQRDVYRLPGIEPLELNLSVPHRISAAAAKMGGGRDAPGLLKLPRKAQLRTSLCLQVSGVRRPKARHASFAPQEAVGGKQWGR